MLWRQTLRKLGEKRAVQRTLYVRRVKVVSVWPRYSSQKKHFEILAALVAVITVGTTHSSSSSQREPRLKDTGLGLRAVDVIRKVARPE